MKKKLVVSAFLILVLIAFAILLISGVHYKNAGLRADLMVTKANIGIRGISKMYEATLTNHGLLPVGVTRCDFIDDTLSSGTSIAYAVQRFDERSKRWTMVVEFGESEFCKPYPLGIVEAKLRRAWLWPGQTLSTGEEASAARNGFSIGDRGRFVVFTGTPGDYSSALLTWEFRIDEHAETDVPLRVRH